MEWLTSDEFLQWLAYDPWWFLMVGFPLVMGAIYCVWWFVRGLYRELFVPPKPPTFEQKLRWEDPLAYLDYMARKRPRPFDDDD